MLTVLAMSLILTHVAPSCKVQFARTIYNEIIHAQTLHITYLISLNILHT